jgi:hypothetical protein
MTGDAFSATLRYLAIIAVFLRIVAREAGNHVTSDGAAKKLTKVNRERLSYMDIHTGKS